MQEGRKPGTGPRMKSPLQGETLQPEGTLLAIAEWESPGGETMWIAPLHIHHEDDEIWYVLEGKLIVRIGTEDLVLEAGGAAIAPRGVAHSYRNPGPERVRYLLVMPERVRRLIEAIHTTPRDETSMRELFHAFDSEYIGWPHNA